MRCSTQYSGHQQRPFSRVYPTECSDTGQLNEVELENQTLKATLEDLQGRHGDAVARLEATAQGNSQHLSQIADLRVQFWNPHVRRHQQESHKSMPDLPCPDHMLRTCLICHCHSSNRLSWRHHILPIMMDHTISCSIQYQKQNLPDGFPLPSGHSVLLRRL